MVLFRTTEQPVYNTYDQKTLVVLILHHPSFISCVQHRYQHIENHQITLFTFHFLYKQLVNRKIIKLYYCCCCCFSLTSARYQLLGSSSFSMLHTLPSSSSFSRRRSSSSSSLDEDSFSSSALETEGETDGRQTGETDGASSALHLKP